MADGERQSGDVLDGRYQLVERLGRGGFGDVWRADELLPDGSSLRQVALKLLHTSLADSGDWSAEARIIASLRHSALVTIYAAGLLSLERPTPFVAMELLIGTNLGDFISRGQRVPWRRVLAWARETAAALDTIHRAGVVHLDLKPANLFLPKDGGVKVLDFGIARQGRVRTQVAPLSGSSDELSTAAFMVAQEEQQDNAGPELTDSMTRSVVGTPGFMAPEIFEDGEPGPATDAYALAACMVQLSTGRLPQKISERPDGDAGTSVHAWFAEVQSATVRGQLRDLSAEHADLPAALVSLLERWLALDPVSRRVDSGTMRAQLDEVWTRPHGCVGNPYRGLSSYRLEDEGKLYGRAPDIARIARELFDQPCVVLQGEGGVGLESLAVAGVVPELARSFADDHDDWRVCLVQLSAAHLSDGRTPDAALKDELGRWLERHGVEDVESPIDALEAWAVSSRIGLTLVLDDLHRLLDCDAGDRRDVERLVDWLAQHHPGLRLIGTLPEEHTAAFLEMTVGERLRPWLRFLSAPQPSLVREIVEQPARAHGRELRGGSKVVEALQLELQADGSRLPLVSLALSRWWEACDGDLSSEQWDEQGGLVGALAKHADQVFEALDPLERERADGLLLRLVSVEGQRLEVPRAELLGRTDDDDSLAALLGVLVTQRLVQCVSGKVRLSHPELADSWPRLHERRLHDIERLTFLEELRSATQRWLAAGRPASQTWDRGRLRETERRMASLSRDLGEDERAFVVATRGRVRLGTMLRVLAAAVAVGVVVLGIWLDRTVEQRARDQARDLEYARTSAAVGSMVTRSRRASDPYRQVALLSGAIEMGSADPALPFELYSAASDLPKAKFLSLQKVPRPTFPWGGRWLIGGSGAHAVAFNFDPPEGKNWGPVQVRFKPHGRGMYDFVPIPFDSSFITRGLDGQLKVWRLRAEGQVGLAAVSPMKCVRGLSAVLVAERAPVVACTTPGGLARWDLRRVDQVVRDGFQGRALHLSPDGEWLAAARLRKVLLWNASAGRRHELEAEEAPSLARFSPRDPLVALVRPDTVEVFDLRPDEPKKLYAAETLLADPVAGRWSDAGIDFAVCNYEGDGDWIYLREGGRADGDKPPPATRRPCRARRKQWPKILDRVSDYQGLLGKRSLGPRVYEGGWMLEDRRFVTRDLVIFDGADPSLRDLLEVGHLPKGQPDIGDSVAAVVRDGDEHVAWQVGANVRVHRIDPSKQKGDFRGKEVLRRQGRLLGRCPDGRLLAWRHDDDKNWELFGVRNDVKLRTIKRRPGFVLGADPECKKVFVQWLDGQLAYVEVAGGDGAPTEPTLLKAGGGGFVINGYVYDVRPSKSTSGAGGLWMALSSGSMIHVDANASVTAYGHATPRPTAMADGTRVGELIFADQTGVVRRSVDGKDELLLSPTADHEWEDMRVLPDGKTLLLSRAHGLSLLDLERRAVVHELDTENRGRLAQWDEQGSILVWAFSFQGQPRGLVIPVGVDRARNVGAAASNLRAKLGPEKQVVLELE